MLLFVSSPELLSEATRLESQPQAPQVPQDSIATTASTQRPKLSMVWRKELDGTRERLVAHWVVDR